MTPEEKVLIGHFEQSSEEITVPLFWVKKNFISLGSSYFSYFIEESAMGHNEAFNIEAFYLSTSPKLAISYDKVI